MGDWGQGAKNNTIGWGQAAKNNAIGYGEIYADSWAGDTDITGVSADFSYAAASYAQDGVNPTPTITGSSGGTFSATPAGLTLNSSTGEITLSSSTIASYIITYTVSGVSSNVPMGITAASFSNVYSMLFDGVDDYLSLGSQPTLNFTGSFSLSMWVNWTTTPGPYTSARGLIGNTNTLSNNGYKLLMWNEKIQFFIANGIIQYDVSSGTTVPVIVAGDWHNICVTYDGTDLTMFIDSVQVATVADTPAVFTDSNFMIGASYYGGTLYEFPGKLDEVALWNSALTSTHVGEVFNSGSPNNLDTLSTAPAPMYWNRMGD